MKEINTPDGFVISTKTNQKRSRRIRNGIIGIKPQGKDPVPDSNINSLLAEIHKAPAPKSKKGKKH